MRATLNLSIDAYRDSWYRCEEVLLDDADGLGGLVGPRADCSLERVLG